MASRAIQLGWPLAPGRAPVAPPSVLANVVNISTRTDWNINRLTVATSSVYVTTKVAFKNGRKAMKNIRLVYANSYLQSNTGIEMTDLGDLRVRGSVEVDGSGTRNEATWDNGITGYRTLAAGGYVVSDIIPGLQIGANQKYYVHTLRHALDTTGAPNSAYYMKSTRGEGYGNSATEATAVSYFTGGTAYPQSDGFNGYGPVGILGEAVDGSRTECVWVMHDSIVHGTAEAQADGDADGNRGFISRGFGPQGYYCWRMGRPGATIAGCRKANRPIAFALLRDYATSAIYQLSENSMAVGTLQADYLSALNEIKADKSVPIIGTTLGPKTTSTDNWATAANQTVLTPTDAYYAVTTTNAIRSNMRIYQASLVPSLLSGVIDFWAAVRSPSDFGKWNSVAETAVARLANDAIHPTVDGQIAGATATVTAINAGLFNYS